MLGNALSLTPGNPILRKQGGGVQPTPQIQLSNASVPESAASGSQVGVLSVSNGTGTWTFTKTADPDSKFAVSGANLNLAATVDFETKTSHSVTIQATNGTDAISRTFSISVTNLLEGTLGPTAASFTAGTAAGTLIAVITGLDVGANETIESVTPNDGRLALDATRRNLIVGLSAASAGAIAATLTTSAGRTLLMSITVNAAGQPADEVPFTVAMASPVNWYSARNADSLKAVDGTTAGEGLAVETWQDQGSAADHLASKATSDGASTAATRGSVGPASAAINGFKPLKVGAGVATNRYNQTVGSLSMSSGGQGQVIVALYRYRPPATALNRTILGTGPGGFGQILGGSLTTAQGALHAQNIAGLIKTDLTERIDLVSLGKPVAPSTPFHGRLNGSETPGGQSTISLNAGTRLCLGNVGAGSQGGDIDFFELVTLPIGVQRSLVQRVEGAIMWAYGLQDLLAADHPYRNAAPTAPAGTVSVPVSLQGFNAVPSTFKQTWLGGMYEGQIDSYEGGFTVPPTDTEPAVATASGKWGVPYSYTAPGDKGLAGVRKYLFGGASGRPVATLLRFPLGFAYRGARVVDSASGLIKQFGERYPGQNAAVSAMLSEVVPLGGGLCASYWTVPPFWTTRGTISGNPSNYLTAGLSDQTVRLDTLFDGDAAALSQLATQIDAFSSGVVNDLEYLHQNVAPVRMFALQNEAGNAANAYYGHIHYSAREYIAVYKRVIEKVRASAILSTYGGQPNTVKIIGNSWDGVQSQPNIVTDTEILTTGKTLIQEHFALATHSINAINDEADVAKTEITQARGATNLAVLNDEYWGNDNSTKTEDWEAINSMVKTAHFIVRGQAPTDCFVIHAGKPVGQIGNTGATNAVAYGATFFRRPAPFDQEPTTPGDPRPDIGFGEWAPNPRYGMSQQAWKYLAGCRILTGYNGENAARRQTIFALDPTNKLVVIRVNGATSEDASPIDFGKARVMKGYRFGNNLDGAEIATVNASLVTTATPAERADVWVEQ